MNIRLYFCDVVWCCASCFEAYVLVRQRGIANLFKLLDNLEPFEGCGHVVDAVPEQDWELSIAIRERHLVLVDLRFDAHTDRAFDVDRVLMIIPICAR
jgi:hypothetical protein